MQFLLKLYRRDTLSFALLLCFLFLGTLKSNIQSEESLRLPYLGPYYTPHKPIEVFKQFHFLDYFTFTIERQKNIDLTEAIIQREQYKHAKVGSRDFTGVGFYTDFHLPENIVKVTEPVEYA